MNRVLAIGLLASFMMVSCQNQIEKKTVAEIPENEQLKVGNPGAVLIKEMIDSLGGLIAYHQIKDVEYTYIYRNTESGQEDVSLERYVYDGEKSWAKYEHHNYRMMPETEGVIIQGYDGENTWTTSNGELVDDAQILIRADFNRKTNFYWFNMFPKLLDPGTQFEKSENRTVKGVEYNIVEVSFEGGIGDAQDVYLLYINPRTKLVDQFLFTVMDFGRTEPLLMEIKYKETKGLKWPTYRRYAPADWEGVLAENHVWIEEVSKNLKFDNGFKDSLFSVPN